MNVKLDENCLVTVYGGSGFIGRHVVQALAHEGVRVRVAVRRPDLAGHLQPLGGVGQIHAVQANVRDAASVARAAVGADAVVNLVGILVKRGRQTFDAVHREGAETIARAAKEAGAPSLVHVSSLSADSQATSHYARSKAKGETGVLDNFPDAVVLRPSVVFGPEDEFFNRFAALTRLTPVLPAIGGGRTKFQPVHVGDVAQAIMAALDGRAQPGHIYELGGPQVYTIREIMQLTADWTGRRRRFVYVPFWFAKMKAFFWQLLPGPLLTVDQVRALQRDNVVSTKAEKAGLTLSGLGIQPRAAESLVPAYLERFRPHGQFEGVAREH